MITAERLLFKTVRSFLRESLTVQSNIWRLERRRGSSSLLRDGVARRWDFSERIFNWTDQLKISESTFQSIYDGAYWPHQSFSISRWEGLALCAISWQRKPLLRWCVLLFSVGWTTATLCSLISTVMRCTGRKKLKPHRELFLTKSRHEHTGPLFKALHWLTITIAMFVFPFFDSTLPPYLSSCPSVYTPSRTLRSSSDGKESLCKVENVRLWLPVLLCSPEQRRTGNQSLTFGTTFLLIFDTAVLSYCSTLLLKDCIQFSSIQFNSNSVKKKTLITPQGAILLWSWRARKNKKQSLENNTTNTTPPTKESYCNHSIVINIEQSWLHHKIVMKLRSHTCKTIN